MITWSNEITIKDKKWKVRDFRVNARFDLSTSTLRRFFKFWDIIMAWVSNIIKNINYDNLGLASLILATV